MPAATTFDVAVAGSGPAGAAVAAAAAREGLRTVLVAAAPERPWPATYGAWEGEADAPARHRWSATRVVAVTDRRLDRGYVLLDNDALQASLLAAAPDVVAAEVRGVEHDHDGSTLHLEGGGTVRARVVVDATGHAPVLVRRRAGPRTAWQVAAGVVAIPDRPPAPVGTCTLMDWTGPAGDDPTFLYAMDLGDGRWFLEETSLARRPGLDAGVARRRLDDRLARLGVGLGEVLATEVVCFPMGQAVPPAQRVVAAGAAGGMVHPATGYSVAASLRTAPVLAGAVAAALGAGAPPADAALAAWAALWPPERRAVRALEQYGLGVLLRLGRAHLQEFFEAFFGLPDPAWQAYLTGAASLADTVATMRQVFAAADAPLRWRLATGNPLFAVLAVSGRPS